MKKIKFDIEKLKEMIDLVEKGHSKFLLDLNHVKNVLDKANSKLMCLSQRLKKGIKLNITSGYKLPNSYKGFKVNNTVVKLEHNGKDWFIINVVRVEVWKNSNTLEYFDIPSNNFLTIKDKLFEKFMFIN